MHHEKNMHLHWQSFGIFLPTNFQPTPIKHNNYAFTLAPFSAEKFVKSFAAVQAHMHTETKAQLARNLFAEVRNSTQYGIDVK